MLPVRGSVLVALVMAVVVTTSPAQDVNVVPVPFTTQRLLRLTRDTGHPEVVTLRFFAHGELRPDGKNLAVLTQANRPVPWRLLQVGPGDLCRLAFQTTRTDKIYRICYGGPPTEERSPPWTSTVGLLLEARRWKACDLTRLDTVRKAFDAAPPIGQRYVNHVFHRHNPIAPDPEPFFSRYTGVLRAPRDGNYVFFTSSQDCSFLLIDGKLVVAAPGGRGPVGDARLKGKVDLTAGNHTFEYLHAASGPDACMVAAWQPPGAKALEPIPPKAFADDEVGRPGTPAPTHRTHGNLPDFVVEEQGEVPLLDSLQPLVRVQLLDVSAWSARKVKAKWDFGDGTSGEAIDPVHVYLLPGMVTVTMTARSGPATLTTANRVRIYRPIIPPDARSTDRLADYVKYLDDFDVTKLDLDAALQLLRACDQAGQHERAGKIGRAALQTHRTDPPERAVYQLAEVAGALLRDRLDDPAGARAVWEAAARQVREADLQAICELETADVVLHEQHRRAEAKPHLEAAAVVLKTLNRPSLTARLHLLWGDWHARGRDREAARAAYQKAAEALGKRGSLIEENAWRGSFSRSTESFLREKELDRARDELRAWQEKFPEDRLEGYWPLLQTRYLVARGKLGHAAVLATDMAAVNMDSAYADQLAYLAAECEEKLGHKERAAAAYRSFLTDFPGSPLVPDVRKKLGIPAGVPAPKPTDKK